MMGRLSVADRNHIPSHTRKCGCLNPISISFFTAQILNSASGVFAHGIVELLNKMVV